MSFNKHGNIELAPTTTKVPVPFVAVFDKKEAAPTTEAASSKSINWRPSRPNENVAVAPDTPFPRATLAKRVSTRERCVRGVQQRYSAAALNLL